MPETRRLPEVLVIDVHCLGGDRLSENWVFFDLLHFRCNQGVDIFARYRDYSRT